MPIVLSDHAKQQLRRRNIPQNIVISAVQTPEEVLPSFKGRKLRRISVDDKILEVVTRSEGSKVTVITAYYLEDQ